MHSLLTTICCHVMQLKLMSNMRVAEDEIDFSSHVLTIGDGTVPVHPEEGPDRIQIADQYLVKTEDELIDKVFPNVEDGYSDKYYIARRAILTPRNENVDKINETIMTKFPGREEHTYLLTLLLKKTWRVHIQQISSTPLHYQECHHTMTLKCGTPVILLGNLRGGPGGGLRNGTQVIVLNLGEKVLDIEVASGTNQGKCVLIPRITIAPSDTELPFTLKRQQFPVRPCFAMSTNKAQGQTLDFVGTYLPDHVFTFGQLYVTFSRV